MRIVDLTLPVPPRENDHDTTRLDEWEITWPGGAYTAMVYHFDHWSMSGTYIDFPGHIKATDDGADSANYPGQKLYRVDATVIRLDRADGSGKVTADELIAACDGRRAGGALVINALGRRQFDEIIDHSVYLATDAVQWIAEAGVHLLVTDVYESPTDHQGMWETLFAAHVTIVAHPVNLHLLPARVKVTALPLRFEGVTQLPCRVIAEIPDPPKPANQRGNDGTESI